ncbi:hypothetical protein [[Clostridium] symbiosum]|jgi:hypothetical protein|uniref:hypothetical protein n=1 Tax=Clostridium symbiosum TaxID=1512 RepID=UPI00189FBF72|nr:hypothetical protein [[Clostridium] symbiosum]
MSDITIAYEQLTDFLNSETEKTLLLCGISDKEKHQTLLKALNNQGKSTGLIYLIHTTKDGMDNFFRWAELYDIKLPKKYGEPMRLSNLTIIFDNMSTKGVSRKYDNYNFDFMIVWPIQSVAENSNEIQMLKEMSSRQKTKKIIFPTLHEPWVNPKSLEPIVDRIIKLDCENDDPEEYNRIMSNFNEDKGRRGF